ncbi:murein transglycosylase A [Desulfohalobiaceae bacterium Ax17]|uniref:murein transglycosylase A n=1 Tax=Desulfovulcanus ferrireducens TaxID=2831190 RepID=UPI00207BC241|nr:murein transglycosylase A [Desulfovulcanus ferrireducens]MBT8763798.1 murein transglycosylase A [Desulfovulcanus ferrireducens]
MYCFCKLRLTKLYLCCFLLILVWGCAPKAPEKPYFDYVQGRKIVSRLPRLPIGQELRSWQELKPSIQRSLEFVRRKNGSEVVLKRPDLTLTWQDLQETLELLLELLPRLDQDPKILSDFFDFYELKPDVLLTGYYEPWLEGSLEPSPEYPYPVYACPDDLKVVDLGLFHPRWQGQRLVYRLDNGEIKPYYSRAEIDGQGVLAGKGLEIAWVKDKIALFFLHIQGSGRLVLPDGQVKHVLYAGKNGRPYVSLGRVLADNGYLSLENVSLQSIRKFLKEHAEIADDLLYTNPSYVFFRLGDNGPLGSMGQPLTPWVSVASDHSFVPLGSVLFLQTRLPVEEGREKEFSGLVLAQDRGGAINGNHFDLFCGSGSRAEYMAGHLKKRAEIFLLVRKK